MAKVEKFGLRPGMNDAEIVSELKGRTHGETAAEVQTFLASLPEGTPSMVPQVREIIQSDGEHALVRRYEQSVDHIGGRHLTPKYYLSGITDEGSYFVHPLGERLVYERDLSLANILRWVNRVDEGFIRRVQGDILCQFVPYREGKQVRREKRYAQVEKKVEQIEVDTEVSYWVPGNGVSAPDRHGLQERVNLLQGGGSYIGDPVRIIEQPLSVRLGNHRLSIESGLIAIARSWSGGESPVVIVDGPEMMFQHGEHGLVREKIPKNHYALLAGQRGRTFTVQGTDRVAGFD